MKPRNKKPRKVITFCHRIMSPIQIIRAIKAVLKHFKILVKSCEFISGVVIGATIYFYVYSRVGVVPLKTCVLDQFQLLNTSNYHPFMSFIDPRKHAENIAVNRLDNKTVALQLRKRIQILCWVMAISDAELDAAIYIRYAWGHRCSRFIVMSSHTLESVNTIRVFNSTDNIRTWNASRKALWHLFDHERNYDWYYFADLKTFTILENLRFLLSGYLPEMPIYFGHKFKKLTKNGFMYTRPGYVLSRNVLMRFGFDANDKCRLNDAGFECVELGRCMENIGVIAADSRDKHQRDRFVRSKIGTVMLHQHSEDSWMDNFEFYPVDNTTNAISNTAIAFSDIPPPLMMTFHYILYNLRAFGVEVAQEAAQKLVNWRNVVDKSQNVGPRNESLN